MRQSSDGGSANIGGSSILVIFMLLCITTFATLAMVSATASFRLATQVARAADDFFAADSFAEEMLAEISAIIRSANGQSIQAQVEKLGAMYNDGIITYSIIVNESLRLDVELHINGADLVVHSWVQVAVFDPAEYGGGGITLWPGF